MHIPVELPNDGGPPVRIHRVWPRSDGSLVIEGREPRTGRIRAGRIDAEGCASLVPFRDDRALPGLDADPSGELLVHRLKRRAVVRADGRYTKFLAGGKAAAVRDAHLAAAAGLAGSGVVAPDVVAASEHSITLSAVPGVSLHDLGRGLDAGTWSASGVGSDHGSRPLDAWSRAWALWAERWPAFVGTSISNEPSMAARIHSAQDEVRTLERWVGLAVEFDALGVSEDRLRRVSASVGTSLLNSSSPAGLAHRDLHDKQVLVDPGTRSVGIIDCDTLALAEPALDLANLAIHLNFREAQGLLPAGTATVGGHYIHEVAEVLAVPFPRFEAYAAATALRLACVYAFRPPYRDMASTWFSELEERLGKRTFLSGMPA
ncbi:phosphotransferase [Arthrobacter sp. EH-1B-1]|uniref:Phosphotransferase n=1 Tax=Arthrobacter vasquezii TaxID=2977629 RepID=A0ABT6CXB7_9MICC|nr:phosphotransferase [Arthrobacter vasquezii]MDF9278664.1 phosphotransferase [Arthrobacter vasquezii]